ncbi:hypothetical protein NHJ6243_000510 [Beauveria neobassiana]
MAAGHLKSYSDTSIPPSRTPSSSYTTMCFKVILYECGHEEKSLLEWHNRIGLRGLVKALLDLLRPNGEGQPLPCDDVAAESARRGHKCRWCLMQQIPDLLQRERQRLRMLRGDFADGLVEPVQVRSLPRRAIQSLPQYAWVACPEETELERDSDARNTGGKDDSRVQSLRESPERPSRKQPRGSVGETANTLRSQSL